MPSRRAVVATVLAAAIGVAGCGGGGNSSVGRPASPPTSAHGGPALLLRALDRTKGAKTARVSITMLGSGSSIDLDGVLGMATPRAEMTMRSGATGRQAIEDVRVIDGTVYELAGEDWTVSPRGITPAINTLDPSVYLAYLQGIGDDVEKSGSDMLRGSATTRYTATVDLPTALRRVATTLPAHLDLQKAVDTLGAIRIPVAVWLDGEGRVRKVELTMATTRGQHDSLKLTMELYDFGVAVNVQVPPDAPKPRGVRLPGSDLATEADLRQGLAAERQTYSDTGIYDDASDMQQNDSTLDWTGALDAVVGNVNPADSSVVCLSERSRSGTVFSIGDVAWGPNKGTYYGRARPCPDPVTAAGVAALGSRW